MSGDKPEENNMNWKTTATGVLSIVVAVAGAAVEFLKTGKVPDLAVLLAAVIAGVGLIKAADAK
jgi:EamA domain-containing membrane protein RarD